MEVEFPVIESEYSFINKGMPVGIDSFYKRQYSYFRKDNTNKSSGR